MEAVAGKAESVSKDVHESFARLIKEKLKSRTLSTFRDCINAMRPESLAVRGFDVLSARNVEGCQCSPAAISTPALLALDLH